MEEGPKISDAEWEVMKVVWDHAPMTATEVLERLPHDQWKQKTVNTFLARLEAKGVISSQREGRANVYSVVLSESECCRTEGSHFLSKVFRGKVAPMMLHFIENEELTDKELDELRMILEQKAR
ncbi:BlaI/MecI/CopY family transcriptional regulator [Pelagicoccus sp. SDUM812003]|uniref:BlaI/MecI/CopY family transcriptional regulator n=1 Tax=Pelagicoccus sp. SDUM812003 TaxID=3041267 RepID=UPI00280D4940|nr:BlaI/MecI/CopY family transcriptional regulator [Pelagicoccus sp. SDUM812003]MDQ8202673.1 BlaI/MecI/CopY family transcriptional regulator [Pelagicoccus sp. SDUM812003]